MAGHASALRATLAMVNLMGYLTLVACNGGAERCGDCEYHASTGAGGTASAGGGGRGGAAGTGGSAGNGGDTGTGGAGGGASYTVSVTTSGLTGTGLVIQNGSDTLEVAANGTTTFANPLPNGSAYAVAVKTQPSSPNQVCAVANGSGTIAGANVTDVTITCASSAHTVGGSVVGLVGSGLVLQNNGGDNLALTANGAFAFAAPIASGSAYLVTVKAQPAAPSQTCTVTGGSGSVGSSNVTTVNVTCTTNTYNVAVTVSGLAGSGLVLRNNGADSIAVTANGTKTFATKMASGAMYNVSVQTQPTMPSQICTITSPMGTVGGADVTLVASCVTSTYSIGGSVTGLSGSGLVLQNNGGDALGVSANGAFTFATKLVTGANYAVTVKTHPAGQSCKVTSGSGTVATSNVINVAVACSAASIKLLSGCASTDPVSDTFTGAGCHSPATAGASYIIMGATPQATLWSGPNCTGCSLVVTDDLTFCWISFPGSGCGGVNDGVGSVSIP